MTAPMIPCARTREAIASRFRAGESVAELVYDYGRPTEAIEAAIREWMVAAEQNDELSLELPWLRREVEYLRKRLDECRERTK